jgi:hypothetical protein
MFTDDSSAFTFSFNPVQSSWVVSYYSGGCNNSSAFNKLHEFQNDCRVRSEMQRTVLTTFPKRSSLNLSFLITDLAVVRKKNSSQVFDFDHRRILRCSPERALSISFEFQTLEKRNEISNLRFARPQLSSWRCLREHSLRGPKDVN